MLELIKMLLIFYIIFYMILCIFKFVKKSKFEVWSFLGGVVVGFCVMLVCVGFVYCIIDRKKYLYDSV